MNLQLTLALRYLSGRKLRTTLTTLAIVFGVLVIFGMNSMLPTIVQAFQASTMAAANEVDATITTRTGEVFSENLAARVAAVDGVRVVSESLERPISLPSDYFDRKPGLPDRVTAVTVAGVRPEAARSVTAFLLVDGRFLEAGDSLAAVITESLAIGVIERRREIGMLRAVGATRQQVGTIILAEAVILAAIGTAFGLLAGLYLGYSVISAVNAAGLAVDYVFPAAGLILGVVAGLLFGVAAAIIPARQAAGLQIVTALRYE